MMTPDKKSLEAALKRIKDLEDINDEMATAIGMLIKATIKLSRRVDDGNTAAAFAGKNWIPVVLYGDLEPSDMDGAWKLAVSRLDAEKEEEYRRKQLKLLKLRERVTKRNLKAKELAEKTLNENGGGITK
jgi:hypothetical protein